MKKAKNVEEYIDFAPKETQAKLKELRKAIKSTAPKAMEKISYGMPYYDYLGRLAYFSINKAHIGLYIMTPILEEHKKEVKEYATSKATLRFPLSKKLPIALIKKLIKAGIKKNQKKNKRNIM